MLSGNEQEEERFSVSQHQARFTLSYKSLIIGYLSFEGEEWHFEYSDEFKRQDELKPLMGFPQLDKVYTTPKDELWPFFQFRIPRINQRYQEKTLLKHSKDPNNAIDMLATFGKRSINNPYVLELTSES